MRVAALWRDPTWPTACIVGFVLGLIAIPAPRVAVLLIGLAVCAFVVLTRPQLMLLAMIAALPWENLLHYPSAELSTVKGIGAAVLVAYLVRLLADRNNVVQMPALLGIATALGLWVAITTILSSDPSLGLTKLIRWALFLTFFFLVVQLVNGRREVVRVLRVVALSVGAAGAYTLWQFVGGQHGLRASGPLEDPNDLAYLMACTLPIAAYLFVSEPRRRLLWGACFVLSTGAMLATFSRGALIGLAALLVWGILTRRVPARAIAIGLVTGLALVAIAFTAWKPLFDEALEQKEHIAQQNIESREDRWAAAVTLAESSPLIGVGTGLYPLKSTPILRHYGGSLPAVTVPQTVAHNTYLGILAENGIPGLALFLAYLGGVWMVLRRSHRWALAHDERQARLLVTALQSSLVIALVAGVFLSEELTPPFWLLGGLAVVLWRALSSQTVSEGVTAAEPAGTPQPAARLGLAEQVA